MTKPAKPSPLATLRRIYCSTPAHPDHKLRDTPRPVDRTLPNECAPYDPRVCPDSPPDTRGWPGDVPPPVCAGPTTPALRRGSTWRTGSAKPR